MDHEPRDDLPKKRFRYQKGADERVAALRAAQEKPPRKRPTRQARAKRSTSVYAPPAEAEAELARRRQWARPGGDPLEHSRRLARVHGVDWRRQPVEPKAAAGCFCSGCVELRWRDLHFFWTPPRGSASSVKEAIPGIGL